MDNKLADAEMTQKFYFSLLEEFLEEYQDALDFFRQHLAFYYDSNPDHHKRPAVAVPLPPPIAKSLPPRIPDVDYYDNYDKHAAIKRAQELCFYHEQLVTETNQIMEYREAIEDDPNCMGIEHYAIDMLDCRIMRAIEFYTLNNDIGRCLYSEESREQHVHKINTNRKLLEMAGFDHNGFPIRPQQQ